MKQAQASGRTLPQIYPNGPQVARARALGAQPRGAAASRQQARPFTRAPSRAGSTAIGRRFTLDQSQEWFLGCHQRAFIEDPGHVCSLEEAKRCGARQRMLLRFLELGPAAGPYHRGLAERLMNPGHHLARILGLLPTYGAPAMFQISSSPRRKASPKATH